MFNIIPCWKTFFAVTKKEASFAGVLEAREAYNISVKLRLKYDAEIILCRLIDQKIEKHLNPYQKPHFYNLVGLDNTTTGVAGYTHENCLIETAKVNSFKRKTIILALEDVPNKEVITNNKKIVIMKPHEFIRSYKVARETYHILQSKVNFIEYLDFLFFEKDKLLKMLNEIKVETKQPALAPKEI